MTTYSQPRPAGTPTWVDLMSPEIDKTRAFYHAVFGWDYDISGPEFGGYTTARLGPHTTAGMSPNPAGVPPMPSAWALHFASEHIGSDVQRVSSLGGKVLFPPLVVGTFGSMAVCEDPTGATFNLWQAGQHIGWQVADEPGSATWFELYSPDAKKARDFYAALLGATAEPMPGGMEYYVLKRGDDTLAGVMQIDPSWGAFRPQWMVYFTVANTDETVARVREHGGKAMGPIDESPFGRIAALADPFGAFFKVVQPPAG